MGLIKRIGTIEGNTKVTGARVRDEEYHKLKHAKTMFLKKEELHTAITFTSGLLLDRGN